VMMMVMVMVMHERNFPSQVLPLFFLEISYLVTELERCFGTCRNKIFV